MACDFVNEQKMNPQKKQLPMKALYGTREVFDTHLPPPTKAKKDALAHIVLKPNPKPDSIILDHKNPCP